MKSKTLILMVVAVVCGLAAAYMTNQLLAQRDQNVKALVAKKALSPWTFVKDPTDMFEEQDVPKDQVPPTYVKNIAELRGRTLLKQLDAGQVVSEECLQGKDKSGLEAYIPPGYLAMAVKVSAETAVGGFVQPNSHVDVIHTVKRHEKIDTHIILEDILVRAVDLRPERQQEKPGQVPATVTLQVTPEDALVLTRAQETGTIRLALRPAADNGKKLDKKPELDQYVDPKDAPKPEPTPEPAKDPGQIDRLTIFNGNHVLTAVHRTEDGYTVTEIGDGGTERDRPRPEGRAKQDPQAPEKPGAEKEKSAPEAAAPAVPKTPATSPGADRLPAVPGR